MKLELLLQRTAVKPTYVIGKILRADGTYICDTLEPANCIPCDEYSLTLEVSPKFQRYLIHVNNVPGRTGILIHPGNTPADTAGCILPGKNSIVGEVTDSVAHEKILFELVREFPEATLAVHQAEVKF
jgi:hypothetical protein